MARPVRWRILFAVAASLALPGSGDAAPSPGARQAKAPVVAAAVRAQADTLGKMARLGKLSEAESGARELLAAVEREYGPRSLEAAVVIDVLVDVLLDRGKSRESEPRALAERSLAIRERLLGRQHADVATSLLSLGKLHLILGDYAAATAINERALAIQEKVLAPDDPAVGRILYNLAITHYSTGNHERAQVMADRALANFEKAQGPNHPNVARALHVLAALHEAAGKFALQVPLLERALAIHEKAYGPEHQDLAISLNNLALAHHSNGDAARARPLSERAIAIQEKALGPEHPLLAKYLKELADISRTQGDFIGARSLFERALGIQEKGLGPDHPDVGYTCGSLGSLLVDMGDYSVATVSYERALAILEKALGPDHAEVAEVLSGLAITRGELRQYDVARPLFERAAGIWEKAFGPENFYVGYNLISLASLSAATGDYATARPLFERGLAIEEKVQGGEHPQIAKTLDDFARAALAAGQSADALGITERAVAIKTRALGANHPELARSLNFLSYAEASQGKTAEALVHALEAERIAREHLQLTSQALSELQALRYAAVRTSGLDLALTLASGGLDPAPRRRVLDALIRSRAVVLDVMGARHRAIGGATDPKIARLAADLAATRTRLATLLVRGLGDQKPDAYRTLIDEAREANERAERSLAAASAAFASERSHERRGLSELAASLPGGSALVAFAQYRRLDLAPSAPAGTPPKVTLAYLAFVQRDGGGDPEVVDLGGVDAADSLIAAWKREASGQTLRAGLPAERAEARYRRAGEALRKRMWDPLASALAGADRVFVVPDGAMNLVSVAALPAEGGGYLIEHGPLVHYVSAERDLVIEGEARSGEGLLALGAPNYDAVSGFRTLRESDAMASLAGSAKPSATSPAASAASYRGPRSACTNFGSMRFEELPATGEETRAIVQLWKKAAHSKQSGLGGAQDLREAAASESEFKRLAPGRRVLHLATHGFFLGDECESALQSARGIGSVSQAPEPTTLEESRAVTGENPLLLAGLVLAGANNRAAAGEGEDDGILTADEIASLDLTGVEWAVLSACETGVGDVRAGEGVFGLRRAFQVAGAATLIMSLWSVDDDATRDWMKALYEGRLRQRLGTATAVHQAGLKILARRRAQKQSTHPFFWAAFVAAGDWR